MEQELLFKEPTYEDLIALFDVAAENLQWPKLSFQDFKLQRAGPRSRHPGGIHVVLGANNFVGTIQRDGTFEPRIELPAKVWRVLEKLKADPISEAAFQGQQTNWCCFCNRELTDIRSRSKGYGPICAEKWSLPWGDVSMETKVAELERKMEQVKAKLHLTD